ncbi:MAG: 2-phospho-L-lactate transferase CofD family protein, partial [Rhodovibrionaceae bacterium]
AISFAGAEAARAPQAILDGLGGAAYDAVVLCPSNPLLSIDPILRIETLRGALAATPSPVIAVSPLVGGQALKGPAAKLMKELGHAASVEGIADHYRGLIDGLVIDTLDRDHASGLRVASLPTQTVMRSLEDRERLARDCIAFSAELAERRLPSARRAGC